MNLAMTLGAAAVEEKHRGGRAWSGRMLCGHMTSGAESRIAHFQEAIVHRPVRFVTIGTIFHCGRMFPKKRPASFSVACVAILIDAVLLQLSWARASVRIVTVAAGDLSLSNRHVRRT